MNVVIVKHNQNGQSFLFSVPEGKELTTNDRVRVKTRKGLQDAVCQCPNFHIDPEGARALVGVFGGTLPLAPVVGVYHYESWGENANG